MDWKFVGGLDIPDVDNLCSQFCIGKDKLENTKGVCWSSEPDYEVSMRAIYKRGDQFFEVEAGHCSCYGFEDAWQPAEVTREYIKQLVQSAYDNKHRWGVTACDDFLNSIEELAK